jgi:hypothetical protein
MERMWNASYQNIHRETWQDDLERKEQLMSSLLKSLESERLWRAELEAQIQIHELEINLLKDQLAEKEGEIARLTVLLEKRR